MSAPVLHRCDGWPGRSVSDAPVGHIRGFTSFSPGHAANSISNLHYLKTLYLALPRISNAFDFHRGSAVPFMEVEFQILSQLPARPSKKKPQAPCLKNS